jgi:hypothetical protein
VLPAVRRARPSLRPVHGHHRHRPRMRHGQATGGADDLRPLSAPRRRGRPPAAPPAGRPAEGSCVRPARGPGRAPGRSWPATSPRSGRRELRLLKLLDQIGREQPAATDADGDQGMAAISRPVVHSSEGASEPCGDLIRRQICRLHLPASRQARLPPLPPLDASVRVGIRYRCGLRVRASPSLRALRPPNSTGFHSRCKKV